MEWCFTWIQIAMLHPFKKINLCAIHLLMLCACVGDLKNQCAFSPLLYISLAPIPACLPSPSAISKQSSNHRMLNFDVICIEMFLWAGWTELFCKSSDIMFRDWNLFPCHLRDALSLCLSLSFFASLPHSCSSLACACLSLSPSLPLPCLSLFCARIYMHTFPLSHLTHKRSAAVTCRWLLSEFLSDCFQNRKCFEERAETMCRSWPTLNGLAGYSEH